MTSFFPIEAAPRDAEIERLIITAAENLLRDLAPLEAASSQWSDGEIAYAGIERAMSRCLATLEQTGLVGEANRGPSAGLWNIARTWLEVGDLQRHAREKPRGYAGDFEMLAKIFREVHSPHPLGRWFDKFFQAQAAPAAVRNRMHMVSSDIVAAASSGANHLKIVVIGCASALDVLDALRKLTEKDREKLSLVLLDLDPRAIEAARSPLLELVQPQQLQLAATNLLRLPKRPTDQALIAGAHRIYCTGLFDYFDDQQAAAMLATFVAHLAPGGESLVFQFSHSNPTRGYMEWIGNWYLRYRNESDLDRIRELGGISRAQCRLSAEPLGVNLCWHLSH